MSQKIAVLQETRKRHGFRVADDDGRPRLGSDSAKRLAAGINGTRQLAGPGDQQAYLDRVNALRAQAGEGPWTLTRHRLSMSGSAGAEQVPVEATHVPKNAPFFDEIARRFSHLEFEWAIEQRVDTVVNRSTGESVQKIRHYIVFKNYPTVHGVALTLAELVLYEGTDMQMIDGVEELETLGNVRDLIGKRLEAFTPTLERMAETRVGYKGYRDAVTWHPGVETFSHLPPSFEQRLLDLGRGVFALYDVVRDLWHQGDSGVSDLLSFKWPSRLSRAVCNGSVDLIRPDVVVVHDPDGTYRPVVTELESAPGGHGMTHAMQVGYNLAPGMVDTMVSYLSGRPYVVLSTWEWAEYLWEQAAFVRALRQRGVDARMYMDRPLQHIHNAVQPGGAFHWKAPADVPAGDWDVNFAERFRRLELEEFVKCVNPDELPADVGDAVVFRFGYFDNFAPATIEGMLGWQQRGARFINGVQFFLENKAVMAAIKVPSVLRLIQERAPDVVDILASRHTGYLAETHVLGFTPGAVDLAKHDRDARITKFAGGDGNNQSWGARSLSVGAQMSAQTWDAQVDERAALPHPVVLQHAIISAQFLVGFVDHNGVVRVLPKARTRLTPFLMRMHDGTVAHAGSMMTLRKDSFRVHGASDSVEMPVDFSASAQAAQRVA